METFSTADLNEHLSAVTDAASEGPVFIMHHRKPRFVLMAFEDFEKMRGKSDNRKTFTFDTVSAEVEEGLLALVTRYEKEGGSDENNQETGLVISYSYVWSHVHNRVAQDGRKAQLTCLVVPLTTKTSDVVLFPLTTQDPGPRSLALPVPEIERRRLTLPMLGPTWIMLNEGNTDLLSESLHIEPISYDPPVMSYGHFSHAFMEQILNVAGKAIREKRLILSWAAD